MFVQRQNILAKKTEGFQLLTKGFFDTTLMERSAQKGYFLEIEAHNLQSEGRYFRQACGAYGFRAREDSTLTF